MHLVPLSQGFLCILIWFEILQIIHNLVSAKPIAVYCNKYTYEYGISFTSIISASNQSIKSTYSTACLLGLLQANLYKLMHSLLVEKLMFQLSDEIINFFLSSPQIEFAFLSYFQWHRSVLLYGLSSSASESSLIVLIMMLFYF